MTEEWRDPFADERAEERERRRRDREARRAAEGAGAGVEPVPGVAGGLQSDAPASEDLRRKARERRELLAQQWQRRLVRARLAHPDRGKRKPLPPQRRTVRRRRIAVLVALLIALAVLIAGVIALADRLGDDGDYAAVPPPAGKLPEIVIAEGLDRSQIAAVTRDAGLRGDYEKATVSFRGFDPAKYDAEDPESLEGFLFPATYELPRRPAVEDLIARQLDAFEANFSQVDREEAHAKNLTDYDVLIIASMIEEEVTVDSERDLVAAVIYNRLREDIALGIDATIRYEDQNHTEPLTTERLNTDTPYNTRINLGLPPGPISNPGLASIEAAANPADVDYLYFVVKPGTCEHNFATTDAEHQEYVAEYEAAREAAGGRSPTPAECP